MLRRLDTKAAWRSLGAGFWPADVPLGCKTVVYGHNGSGKSTLAELLLSLAEGDGATGVVWEDENGRLTTVRAGGASPSPAMAVFTRKWVEDNLAAFLDGDSASAIVTLGREAIDAKEEEARLVHEIGSHRIELADADKQHRAVDKRIEKLVKDVQEKIVSELREFDYTRFTKNKYAVPKVKTDLRAYRGDFPGAAVHAEALKRLGEGALIRVDPVPGPPAGVVSELEGLSVLLADTPARQAMADLEADRSAQSWVEHGLDLHEDRSTCLFCAGTISDERREQLARHFDASWFQIRQRASALLSRVTRENEALASWAEALPPVAVLAGDLQSAYEEACVRTRAAVKAHVTALGAVETVLRSKVEDPSAMPLAPDWSALESELNTTVLMGAMEDHNEQAANHKALSEERVQTVLDHHIGSQSKAFRDLEDQAKAHLKQCGTSRKAAELAEARLATVRQAQFTTTAMADTLTRDLARVYGKNHLSVAVTDDGKSYACRRGTKAGTDLSEGERTTLSLLYFLRKLEDEEVPGGDPGQRIIVIDDPSSSLDREALFATHQWLFDTLKGFGQYIVLTHDFSLLRLFIKSHSSAWGTSMKRITQGDADEIRFPKVAFLEMYAATADGERQSRIAKLPRLLINSTSEYAYLFSMVMTGVADSEDHERLFLLPNAARRILEVFASYKAPHRSDFLSQLEILVESQEGEPYRDVYDFCNRYSHGEGSESIDVLDARAIHGHIRRCMLFLRAVDGEHYERMCQATKADPNALDHS